MATKIQLEMLAQNVDVWNDWRKSHLDEPIDLTGADLSGAILRLANLKDADLSGANLSNADLVFSILRGANLSNANLKGANLSFVDLEKARITNAELQKANLRGVDLQKAYLENTNLSDADLTEANLSEARLVEVVFICANLSNAILNNASLLRINFHRANLNGARLINADLYHSNFNEANLRGAGLSKANLREVNFIMADLSDADLYEANLSGADLTDANLTNAFLVGADFHNADCNSAILTMANLSLASMVETNLEMATLTNCKVYGLSAWALKGNPRDQTGLTITKEREPEITVDDLQIAQFIYLLINNKNVRNVIDTITSKVVLILGSFSPERKKIIDVIRQELHKYNYAPIIFDFDNTKHQTLLETVLTLAGMSRFIIADITAATMVREELRSIVEKYPSKPIQPIMLSTEKEYVTLPEMKKAFKSILETYTYNYDHEFVLELKARIISPAERWLGNEKGGSLLTF